jgi:plasmid maintenance system antidote protein VapI
VGEFRDLLEAAAKRYPTKRAFARAIGITAGRLSRVLGGEHSFDVGNCLTLAKLTGESPSRVLRVAGKSDIADAIEALYGPGAVTVSPKERQILDVWNALTERARQGLSLTMSELSRARDAPIQHTSVSPERTTESVIAGSPSKRATPVPKRDGPDLADAEKDPVVPHAQTDPVSAPIGHSLRARVMREVGALEHQQALDAAARAARAPGQPAPVPRRKKARRRVRDRKHGR